MVGRENHLGWRLSIQHDKRFLPQLRALMRCGLCEEVRWMEDGVHYRSRDQSVSADQLTRCTGLRCWNGEPSLRLRSRANWYCCCSNNGVSPWLLNGTTPAGSQRTDNVAQLLAQGDCVRKTSAVRACSAASRKRYHVPSGMRCVCCGNTSLISSTTAAKPPVCKRRSVAFSACSSRDHGLSVSFVRRSADMRSQSSRRNSTPEAAAVSGDRASLRSTQAHALPSWVIEARVERANEVLPVDDGPLTSVMVPRGMPPPSMASTSAMPLAKTSGACLILSVSA